MALDSDALLEIVEDANNSRENPDKYIEVLIASQPSYPMTFKVRDAQLVTLESGKKVLVIIEGDQEYMSGEIREAIGW